MLSLIMAISLVVQTPPAQPPILLGVMSSVEFAPDGAVVAAGGMDGSLSLWSGENNGRSVVLKGLLQPPLPYSTPQNRTAMDSRKGIISIAFSPDGTQLAAAGFDRAVNLWSVDPPRKVRVFSGHTDAVKHVRFSRDGTMLASASVDRTVRLWNVARGAELATLADHASSVLAVAFSPDDRLLASVDADLNAFLWDVAGRKISTRLPRYPLEKKASRASITFSPDGQAVAIGYSAEGNLMNGALIVHHLAPTADLQNLGARLQDQQSRMEFADRNDGVTAIAFKPGGNELESLHASGYLFRWNTQTSGLVLTSKYSLKDKFPARLFSSMSFSRDGSRMAVAATALPRVEGQIIILNFR